MLINGIPPIVDEDTAGVFKVDGDTLEVKNGVFGLKGPVTQSEASDDTIESIITGYYNGTYSLQDVKDIQAIGDIRTANDTDKAKFKVASHAAIDPIYSGKGQQSGQTIPEMTRIKQVIIDFNHSILKESINSKSNALITIQMLGTISNGARPWPSGQGEASMQSPSYNQTSSPIYSYLNNNFYDACGFKNLIKIVKNPTKLTYNSDTITQCEDKVFLLSEVEFFGTTIYSRGGEGTQYKYFETSSNRIKYPGQGGIGTTLPEDQIGYQERSRSSMEKYFCYIQSSTGEAKYVQLTGSVHYGITAACAL